MTHCLAAGREIPCSKNAPSIGVNSLPRTPDAITSSKKRWLLARAFRLTVTHGCGAGANGTFPGVPWGWQSRQATRWMLCWLEGETNVVSIFSTSRPQWEFAGWQVAQEARAEVVCI